jgi:hypothetical protein
MRIGTTRTGAKKASRSDGARVFDEIHAFALRFVKSAHNHFGEQPHEHAHDAGHRGQDTQQEQRIFDEGLVLDELSPERIHSAGDAHRERGEPDRAEQIHRFLLEPIEKFYRHQIGEHLEHALETVFRLSALPGIMPDLDLGDPCAVPPRVDGQKAMHFPIEPHPLEDFAAIRFQRATEIMQTHAGDEGDEAVRHDAGNVALQRIVLAIFPPARADIESFIEFFEHQRDIGGIILQVAIDRNDDLAAREIEAGHHRGGLAKVAPQMNDFDQRIGGGDFVEDHLALIAAAVIDQHEFPFATRRVHCFAHPFIEGAQITGFVADRHGDGNHQRAAKVKPRHRSAKRELTRAGVRVAAGADCIPAGDAPFFPFDHARTHGHLHLRDRPAKSR